MIILLVSSTAMAAGQSTEGVGIGEKVSVGVDRSDYGMYQSLRVYCRGYALDACDGGFGVLSVPGTLYHYFTVDDPEEWYRENKVNNESGSSEEGSSETQEVHRFS